jgi:hypothetical protein
MDRESDGKIGGELLGELFSSIEDLETQSAGILQFLKGKGLATDEELAPYLRQAADASNVRWRAARIRMEALLASAIEDAKQEFARGAEERIKEKSGPAKAETSEDAPKDKNDAADDEIRQKAQLPKGKEQPLEAKKGEAEPDTEVAAAKEKTKASENDQKPNVAENDTAQKAA